MIDTTEIYYDEIEIYNDKDQLLCRTNNDLTFLNIRIQISKQNLKGYYIKVNNEKYEISENGEMIDIPYGFFRKGYELVCELYTINQDKKNGKI